MQKLSLFEKIYRRHRIVSKYPNITTASLLCSFICLLMTSRVETVILIVILLEKIRRSPTIKIFYTMRRRKEIRTVCIELPAHCVGSR